MINIDSIKVLSYNIAEKKQAGTPSPSQWNTYANLASTDLFNYYNDERSKMLVKVKTGENLFIPPILTDFVVNEVQLNTSGNSASLPSDYVYDIAVKTLANGVFRTVKKVDYDKVESYMNSTIDAPTVSNPIFVELTNTFQYYPNTLQNVYLTYLKQPVTVNWAYTLVGGRPVYDPINSIDFEWDATETFRLLMRLLEYMGISIRDTELAKYAQEQIQTAS